MAPRAGAARRGARDPGRALCPMASERARDGSARGASRVTRAGGSILGGGDVELRVLAGLVAVVAVADRRPHGRDCADGADGRFSACLSPAVPPPPHGRSAPFARNKQAR